MTERILYETCPLCASKNHSKHRTGDCSRHPSYNEVLNKIIQWNKCRDCNHIFTDGVYTEETLEIIFSKIQKNQRVGANIEANRKISARMIDKVTPFKNKGTWLDVGFGNGSLLFTALEYGFKPIGLDLREQTVSSMKRIGIESYKKDICEFVYPEKMSVISMADVLEHTHFPKEVLAAARNLIEDDGVLFLSMPNSESLLWQATTNQNVNPYWGEIEHYHNFSRTRLYSLLEEMDFEPLQYGISERYRMCMEIIAKPKPRLT